ncbi:protein of unknown function DUF454 [Magnetococcus marinus MC-1]|uniref:Inner membrane protein n=1 Tax=Magnetococcus marinus (strain ATCC BAA-1437 / JCM 17883 / MC-1) TaxID=156889 RepID=A0L8Z0_MAGMM|nr:YbaN family protein [Magnetococcus marinus]ABK44433.1 protein of unknown function DUF454 [Magnetococcus marinus MC-1]
MRVRRGWSRHLMVALGWLFFGLGVVGVFLPVMPTTPFMVLALWAFAKGDGKLYRWLYHHVWFGPPLQRWQRWGVIPTRAKMAAIGTMLVSAGFLLWLPGMAVWLKGLVLALMFAAMVFVWSRPSAPPTEPLL